MPSERDDNRGLVEHNRASADGHDAAVSSMTDREHKAGVARNGEATRPPAPGFWQLGWMIFMQPSRLRAWFDAWGFDLKQRDHCSPRLGEMLERAKEPEVRKLLIRFYGGWLFLAMPLVTAGISEILALLGVPIDWWHVAFGVALGVSLGVGGSMGRGAGRGAGFGVAGGVAGGVVSGVICGVASGMIFGVVPDWWQVELGVAFGMTINWWQVGVGVAFGVTLGVASGAGGNALDAVIGSVLFGAIFGIGFNVVVGVGVGVAFGLVFLFVYLRIPIYVYAAARTWLASKRHANSSIERLRSAAARLSFRHHDFIFFSLPGLRSFLVKLGQHDADLAQRVLTEAAESIGQKRPARKALAALQAWSLGCAAQQRSWARVVALDLDFLRAFDPPSEVQALQRAARDMGGLAENRGHPHQGEALVKARMHVEGVQAAIAAATRPSELQRRLPPVARTWLAVIAEEQARLDQRLRTRA